MLLTRLAFWCLSDLRFTPHSGGFGPMLDPIPSVRFFVGLAASEGTTSCRHRRVPPVTGRDSKHFAAAVEVQHSGRSIPVRLKSFTSLSSRHR
jgi:hypothetical protein